MWDVLKLSQKTKERKEVMRDHLAFGGSKTQQEDDKVESQRRS